MWLLLVFAALFLVGASYNLALTGDYTNAVAGLGIAAFMVGVYLFFRRERQKSFAFLTWLVANRDAFSRGPALYEGKPITPDTRLVRFQACLSFLVVSTKAPSRYCVEAYDYVFPIGLVFSLVTLVLGWWGLPWGPLWTLQVLRLNLGGGETQVVADLLAAAGIPVDNNGTQTGIDTIR